MITILKDSQIRKFANEQKKSVGVIEKDYALEWLLYGIYHKKSKIKKHMIFKGGTAIRKIFFPQIWRYSEDLDFTILPDTDPDIIKSGFEDITNILKYEMGTEYRSKIKTPPSEKGIFGHVYFTGPLGNTNKIKIDMSRIEKMIDPAIEQTVTTSYEDLKDFQVYGYTLNEIIAEKIRSMMQRTKVRDYYDIWKIFNMKNHGLDTALIGDMVKKKCTYNNIEYNPWRIFDADKCINLKEYWNKKLEMLIIENLPNFDKAINELQNLLKFLPKK